MSVNKHSKRRGKKTEQTQERLLLEVTKGGLLGAAVAMLLLAVLGLVVYRGKCGWQTAEYVMFAILVIGGFAAGYKGCGRLGKERVLCGAGTGLVVTMILMSVAVLVPGMDVRVGQGGVVAALCLCGGAMGGLLKVGQGKGRK